MLFAGPPKTAKVYGISSQAFGFCQSRLGSRKGQVYEGLVPLPDLPCP